MQWAITTNHKARVTMTLVTRNHDHKFIYYMYTPKHTPHSQKWKQEQKVRKQILQCIM